MEETKKYQIVPTDIIGENNYRKSVDRSLTMVVMPIENEPIFDVNIYPIKSQSEIDLIKNNEDWLVIDDTI